MNPIDRQASILSASKHGQYGRVTSADVARLAGVSQSAVSRVFTDGASASAKTAAKVRQAAEMLGYRPNRLARSLLTGKSFIVGLVVAYLDNYFYPDVLEKLSKALQQKGYHVLIFMADQTAENVDNVVEEILEYQVDAIVTASVALSSELADRCQSAGIHVVQFNRVQERTSFSSVTTDNFSGGVEIARHLITQGYRHFGYIAGWEGASTQRDREAGFRDMLSQNGFDLCFRAVGNFRHQQAYEAAKMLIAAPRRPEALFVANDAMALVVMDVLRHEEGLRVPKDIAIVGYDDIPPASWLSYDLTSFSQPADDMVDNTVSLLMRHIETEDKTPQQITIEGSLKIRGSSTKAKDIR
ncbi:MAG: LacI family DNA-binding transcriptional regulator [Candidatus Puniceispirillaceae bacterium]